MKNILIWIFALAIILGGIWYFWPENSTEPEVTPSSLALATPTPSPVISQTPTPIAKPKKTPTPRPSPKATEGTATPTPSVGAISPIISSVTAYQKTDQPSPGWWISIVGTLPGPCSELLNPWFSQDGRTYFVTLPAQTATTGSCMNGFTQKINIAPALLEAGLYTIYVNDHNWTSFIIESPTPTPTPGV